MRACKDCQWYEAGDYQYVGNCRWNPAYDHVLSDHWCAQFHRKETEEGEGLRTVSEPDSSSVD